MRQFADGEGLQVVNSTSAPPWRVFRSERSGSEPERGGVRVPMWLLFHSYPVILLASLLLLLTAMSRKD